MVEREDDGIGFGGGEGGQGGVRGGEGRGERGDGGGKRKRDRR